MVGIDMEMPECCAKCRFATAFECSVNKEFIKDHHKKAEHCPLIKMKGNEPQDIKLYWVAKLKFDGFIQYYPEEPEYIRAHNEDEAKRIYKKHHRVYGRQEVQVLEKDPINDCGIVRIFHDELRIGDKTFTT